ncbi:hypothetical protein SAY86_006297 [Trapa natans]|uniref:Protein DCL, chloroplastic n=1 Tax=Trapa natans TaxID=22666 RepID=A0AAN7L721_TRANT|nr:hypothetical protein SAY86_006297 [Trapa natans]
MIAATDTVLPFSSLQLAQHHFRGYASMQLSPLPLRFSFLALPRLRALRTGSAGRTMQSSREAFGSRTIGRPTMKEFIGGSEEDEDVDAQRNFSLGEVEDEAEYEEEEDDGVDWEDKILEETAPLVGFARMILHSGRYQRGDRLKSEHERTIVEKLLPYHPESEKKIGCGVDYIMVGHHPDFESSRCLFIVRTDGQIVDFSYWKCIKGLIMKKYPLYADSFILRHFRRQRRNHGR